MKRIVALSLLALVWALTALGLRAGAVPEVFFRAETEAAAIHGFYDHEELFPVPIVNLSSPHTRAAYEPGPSSEALGSFLWDPEAAELGTIVCVLSGNQLCAIPDYPFQAHATHPSAGDEPAPPSLSIDDPEAPLGVRLADERATAGEGGAIAEADVQRLVAVPMSPSQQQAAASLASALALASGPGAATPETDAWLLEVGAGTARSSAEADGADVLGASRARVQGLELLGGLIAVEEAWAEVGARAGTAEGATADAALGRVLVGGFEARIDAGGLVVADQALAEPVAAALTAAANQALGQAGFTLSPGEREVTGSEGAIEAHAFALSLDFRRRVLPEELPDGTTGDDVVRVPVAFASARVSEAEGFAADEEAEEPERKEEKAPKEEKAASDGESQVALPATVAAPPPPPPPSAVQPPLPATAPAQPAPAVLAPAGPVARVVALGIEPEVVVAIAVAALGMVLSLTGLKVLEVLRE